MKKIILSLTLSLLAMMMATTSFAAGVTLAWDESLSQNAVGYLIYYKSGSATTFNGTGIFEGASPIDAENNLSMALSGLTDNNQYTFTVTAYDANGLESSFASEISWTSSDPNPYIPALTYPPNQANDLPSSIVFSWSTPTDGRVVSYSLVFGTNPNLDNAIIASASETGSANGQPLKTAPLFAITGLFGLALKSSSRRRGLLVAGCLGVLLLNGCGSDVSPPLSSTGTIIGLPETPQAQTYTNVITQIDSNSFEIYDFEPATTYYWKIVSDDGVTITESSVQSFVTAPL